LVSPPPTKPGGRVFFVRGNPTPREVSAGRPGRRFLDRRYSFVVRLNPLVRQEETRSIGRGSSHLAGGPGGVAAEADAQHRSAIGSPSKYIVP